MSKKHADNKIPVTGIKERPALVENFPNPDGKAVVWVVDKSKGLDHRPYHGYLSDQEKIMAEKFRFISDRANYILGKSILRIVLGQYLGKDPKGIHFKYGKYGKPALATPSDIAFNISHSEDIVVLGFGKNCSLGIDVEKVKTNIDVLGIAINYFSKHEVRSLTALPSSDQHSSFFRGWTRKESIIKAKGKGLSHSLDTFSVSLYSGQEDILLETTWEPGERDEWALFSFVPSPGYIGALAIYKNVESVEYVSWDHAMLNFI